VLTPIRKGEVVARSHVEVADSGLAELQAEAERLASAPLA
jgi:hypothetical protein